MSRRETKDRGGIGGLGRENEVKNVRYERRITEKEKNMEDSQKKKVNIIFESVFVCI